MGKFLESSRCKMVKSYQSFVGKRPLTWWRRTMIVNFFSQSMQNWLALSGTKRNPWLASYWEDGLLLALLLSSWCSSSILCYELPHWLIINKHEEWLIHPLLLHDSSFFLVLSQALYSNQRFPIKILNNKTSWLVKCKSCMSAHIEIANISWINWRRST